MTERVPNDLFRGDPQDIERGLDEWVAGLERNAARYQELQHRVEEVRLTATSPTGVVTVTVDADGALVDVRFTDRIAHTPPDELGHQLMTALAQARGRIAAQVREVAEETLGADASAERIAGYYRERFPEAGEPQPPTRRPRRGEDDEFDAGSIFD